MAHFLRDLRSKLQSRGNSFRAYCSGSLLLPISALVALLFCATDLSRLVVFFLPLVASTSVCCAAAYLLVAASESDDGGASAKEVVVVRGDRAEVGVLQVFDGANATVYAAGAGTAMRVGCFLHYRSGAGAGGGGGWTRRGVDEDGEEVVFAGRLAATGGGAGGEDDDDGGRELEEEVAALRVDRLAEGVWDSYFGGWSRWNYVTDGDDDRST
uniref:Uncharacterized protein n=1 Tax=Leersia perrieri TaxID=77586 RepID=A0A0D9UZ25_9ORYZ